MASLELAFHLTELGDGKFAGDIEVRGKDFNEENYSRKFPVKGDAAFECDIPIGPLVVHLAAEIADPTTVKLGGHAKWGSWQENFPEWRLKVGEMVDLKPKEE